MKAVLITLAVIAVYIPFSLFVSFVFGRMIKIRDEKEKPRD